ncbi:MAG: hypothetical protein KA163_04580 [Bacteroidia bacterium]|nr:hypothetical protein [Bacteroidia bacterium]
MKHIFTLFFAIIICSANAQTYPWLNQFYNEFPSRGDLLDSSVAANHYRSMTRTMTFFDKKGTKKKRTDTFLFQYDNKGFMTSYEKSNSKNKKAEKHEYTYKDSLLVVYKYHKKGKLYKGYEITRNGKHKITDIVKTNSKGEMISKQHNDFDESLTMITRVTLYDKKNKEKNAVEYSYNDGNNMKQAKEYRKGKLKKVWNYNCDAKGTDEKKVKEIKVCKNVNVDENGNRVESNRIVNHKGEVELRVNTFDKNERMIKQKVYDDLKHKLKSEFSTTVVNGIEETIYKYYDKKERPIWISTATYNSAHKILSSEFVSGKKLKRVFKTTFQYNDKNLMTRSEGVDRKDRKTFENTLTYQ